MSMNNNNENEINYAVQDGTFQDPNLPQSNGMPAFKAPRPVRRGRWVAPLLCVSLALNGVLLIRGHNMSRFSSASSYTTAVNAVEIEFGDMLFSVDSLGEIAPYLKSSDLRDICMQMAEMQVLSMDNLSEIAPYMKSKDLGDVVATILDYSGGNASVYYSSEDGSVVVQVSQ